MTWVFGRQVPDTSLIRFVSHTFPHPATMLDIGSGEGANARELRLRWHEVITVDKDPTVECNHCCDIRDYRPDPWESFDLVYDINTLCHVENPPFEKIRSWLKPKGVFLTICPTHSAPPYIREGKSFTRTTSQYDLRETLQPFFANMKIYERFEPAFRIDDDENCKDFLDSWIAVCRV